MGELNLPYPLVLQPPNFTLQPSFTCSWLKQHTPINELSIGKALLSAGDHPSDWEKQTFTATNGGSMRREDCFSACLCKGDEKLATQCQPRSF